MRSVLMPAILCCMVHSLYAQIRMNDLLSSPLSEDEMGVVLARENYLASHKFNSPWLRELDFRIRPNEQETSLSDYRLRFGILNPREIKANREYYQLLIRQQTFERRKTINSALKRRYQLIIEGSYLMRSLEINTENLAQLKKIKTLLLEESSYDLRELLSVEEDITKQELAINGLRRRMNEMLLAYQQLGLNSLSTFSEERWISGAQLEGIILQKADGATLRLLSDQQQLEREASMLEVNKAEAFSNLGFIQTEYDTERGDTEDERLRFQLGIQIPVFNTDRPDNQRRELELLEEKAEYTSMAKDEEVQRRMEALTIVDFLKDWTLLEEKAEQLERYREIVDELDSDRKRFNQLREYTYYLEIKTLRTRMDSYMRYINFLAASGALAQQPYVNYLSETLDAFELVESR